MITKDEIYSANEDDFPSKGVYVSTQQPIGMSLPLDTQPSQGDDRVRRTQTSHLENGDSSL